jgi:hypothetical protein
MNKNETFQLLQQLDLVGIGGNTRQPYSMTRNQWGMVVSLVPGMSINVRADRDRTFTFNIGQGMQLDLPKQRREKTKPPSNKFIDDLQNEIRSHPRILPFLDDGTTKHGASDDSTTLIDNSSDGNSNGPHHKREGDTSGLRGV